MSGKLKKSNKKTDKKLDRPFDPKIWKRAEKIAGEYQVILGYEDGWWFGYGLEMPYTFGGGETAQACVDDTREALVASVATMLEKDQIPPLPANKEKRIEQVNVQLTTEEKMILSVSAKSKGYRGLADYIRASVLANKS